MSSAEQFLRRAGRKTADRGLRLLKQGKRGVWSLIFSRTGLIVLLLAAQLALFVMIAWRLSAYASDYLFVSLAIAIPVMLGLINSRMDTSAKITWLVLIMLLPVIGILLLIYTKFDIGHRKLKRKVSEIIALTRRAIPQDESVMERLRHTHPDTAGVARYIAGNGCYPVYDGTDARYFAKTEEALEALLADLDAAQKTIYLEYFIIEEGLMWGRVLEVLAKKAAAGLDVRVMFDGTCEFARLPSDYPERLEALGIKCRKFSPLRPFISTRFNYRDHRKITAIDGRVAWTGGFNLADEYINIGCSLGRWKDAGLRLEGDAARSLELMFLQMWGDMEELSALKLPEAVKSEKAAGFVLPFGDNPVGRSRVGESVYLSILNRAHHYVHIMTPYLILGSEMEMGLKLAAELGVDVKIILPGKSDNVFANALAHSHYKSLLESGVKLYEYKPGFVHAKVFVSDRDRAVVGTINLDYRSLSHHFECGVLLRDAPCIREIDADFNATLRECERVTLRSARKEKPATRLLGALLKVIAPLM